MKKYSIFNKQTIKLWLLYVFTTLFDSLLLLSLTYLNTFCIKYILDGVRESDIGMFNNGIKIEFFVLVIMMIVIPINEYLFLFTTEKIMAKLKKEIFKHLQYVKFNKLEGMQKGEVLSKFMNDINLVNTFLQTNVVDFLNTLFVGVGSLIIMFSLSSEIAILSIVMNLIVMLFGVCFIGRLVSVQDTILNLFGKTTQKLNDMLSGFTTIKLFNLQNKFLKEYNTINTSIKLLNKKQVNAVGVMTTGIDFISNCIILLLLYIGGCLVFNNRITLGTLISLPVAMSGVNRLFNELGIEVANMFQCKVGWKNIKEIFDIDIDMDDRHQTTCNNDEPTTNNIENCIDFTNVFFGYNKEKMILNNFNIRVMQGERVFLVGQSGMGKSTIFKLLLAFYRLDKGSIKVYGKDLNKYSIYELRSLFTYVPQESYLFKGTIAENIGYGKKNATLEEIVEAAKMANAHNFIIELSNGYNTEIGNKGFQLSGGQRQKIAIARAFLRNTPIILLDEATASLDVVSEKEINDSLNKLTKGKTTIIITHRLYVLQDNDIVLNIKDLQDSIK